MSTRPSFMARLREAVWPQHQLLERSSPLAAVAGGMASREQYGQALAMLHGVVAPLEEQIQASLNAFAPASLPAPFDSSAWQRTHLLEQDLAALFGTDFRPADLPRCRNLPQTEGLDRALGCLYVLEGSRLGGQVLAASLHEHLGLSPSNGAAYFSSNGSDVGPLWRSFKSLLEEHSQSGDPETMIQAATDCFSCIAAWFAETAHDRNRTP